MKLVMSEALRHMAAKSDKHNHDGWLPFFVHALDTAAVIKKTAECYDLKNSWQTICNIKKNEIVKAHTNTSNEKICKLCHGKYIHLFVIIILLCLLV